MRAFRVSLLLLAGLVGAPSLSLGSPILTSAFESQLEVWLSMGDLTFTNIFTKGPTDDAQDFHAAADNRGATIVLLEVVTLVGAETHIIGGYNPASWLTQDASVITTNLIDRTAFLFNLTASTPFRLTQRLEAVYGKTQTVNSLGEGPIFGDTTDLWIDDALFEGYASQYDYGVPGPCSNNGGPDVFGNSLWTGTPPGCGRASGVTDFEIRAFETYTFAPAAAPSAPVPEPATLLLVGAGAIAAIKRRRSEG